MLRSLLRRVLPRLALTLALAGIMAYTLYHVASSSERAVMKTPVKLHTVEAEHVSARAYLFRDEQVLTMPEEGLVHDLVPNGSKVAKDTPLAEFRAGYRGQALVGAQRLLDSLNRQISLLENSTVTGSATMALAEQLRAKSAECALAIALARERGEWEKIPALEDQMLTALNRYDSLTASPDAILSRLAQLKEQRAALLGGLAITIHSTRSSGYFYNRNHVDGYEDLFTPSALESLTVESFDALTNAAPRAFSSEFAVGKLSYGYHWYLALRLENTVAQRLSEGASYQVRFSENGDRSLELVCEKILSSESGSVVILCADDYPADFSYLRSQAVEITLDTRTGFYLPDSALHTVNGDVGVYVLDGSVAVFRRVEILYRGDGFALASADAEGSTELSLNDLIITSGENLYDGKVYS